MAFRLFVPHHDDERPGRQAELDFCHDANETAFCRVCSVGGDNRPTFAEVLEKAHRCSCNDDIVVVANSDIIFTRESLRLIVDNISLGEVYCLNRWDVGSKGITLWDVEYGQDAWVFCGPPKEKIGGDYWFGVPGCDNRFAAELDAVGYQVLNPARNIRTYHLHASNLRTATNNEAHRIPPPYLYVAPHHLGEQPTIKRAATWEARKKIVARRKSWNLK